MNQLLIFDLDGVLLNTEQLYMEMNLRYFTRLGFSVSEQEYHTFIGTSATNMWQYLKSKHQLPQPLHQLITDEKELKYQTLQQTTLTPSEGIVLLLERLANAGIPMAIASSGMRKNIDLILEKLQLSHFFDHIVSGEQVERGKPEPDIFLKAAAYFGTAPQHCTVIEDSENGVKAAKAAGMFCLGYSNPGSGNQNLHAADWIFCSFLEPKLFAVLGLDDKSVSLFNNKFH
ncbi:HAD family phosphatase [Sphingobacteriales bacterium UPWRP_1]|nr:hypothetical protein BVG80_01125 [Sphingobacteriales bacterium TSM_CSM]PSJ72643.1 HAD family phosphatase [Sphingobacteriales bacterium UPWRP_1]